MSHIFQSSIERNFVFHGNDDLVDTIIPMLEMKVFLPEDQIIRQGEEGKEMYFIATGDCVVTVRDLMREEEEVRMLGRGDFFGVRVLLITVQEIALCAQCKRTASVKSKNYCVTARLDQKAFNEINARFPDFKAKLKEISRKY